MSKFNSTQIEVLETIGSLWEKYGKRRVYFNEERLAKFIGLEINFYNTGNVSSVEWDGVKLSNTKGSEIWYALGGAFMDLDTGNLVIKSENDPSGWSSDIKKDFAYAFKEAVAKAEAEAAKVDFDSFSEFEASFSVDATTLSEGAKGKVEKIISEAFKKAYGKFPAVHLSTRTGYSLKCYDPDFLTTEEVVLAETTAAQWTENFVKPLLASFASE